MPRDFKVILVIAGLDPDGGAGLVADVKTISALGAHPVTILTGIAIQNTYESYGLHMIPPSVIESQLRCILNDIDVDAVKIGMLGNSESVHAVAKHIVRLDVPIVLDPVVRAKVGLELLDPRGIKELIEKLLPYVTLITPNADEASILTGIEVRDLESAKKAAKILVHDYGVRAVLIKGGHIVQGDRVFDLYYDSRGQFKIFESKRISGCWHGAGCTLSSAIATLLALGKDMIEAIAYAREFVLSSAIHGLRDLGKGICPLDQLYTIAKNAERYKVITNMWRAIEMLEFHGEAVSKLIPEVQSNLVMALPKRFIEGINDVAGIPGRIVRYGNRIKVVGPPTFGASKHLARAVIKVMEYDPTIRSAMNIKFDERILDIAKELGYRVSYYDRSEEPEHIKRTEGATIPWGIETAIRRAGGVIPDLIFHRGDWGKEPMINVFGKSAIDTVRKVISIALRY